jgi:hypothetical protein
LRKINDFVAVQHGEVGRLTREPNKLDKMGLKPSSEQAACNIAEVYEP